MTEESRPEDNEVVDQLKEIGQQLRGLFETAWESEKRRELETEIREGMNSLGAQIEDLAEEIKGSEEMARLRAEVQELREAARKGELGTAARDELLGVLRVINAELQKLRDTWPARREGSQG